MTDDISITPELKSIPFEIKVGDIEGEGIFRGYASTFGNIDEYNDIVERGAFARTIKNRLGDISVLWNHDASEPIGYPLKIIEDKKGLFVETQLVLDLPQGEQTFTRIKHGLVKRLSIGFSADPKKQRFETAKSKTIRHLQDIDLWEYSPVTFAANRRAKITSVKSAKDPRELEKILCDAGMSNAAAKYLAARHQFDSGPCEAGSNSPDYWEELHEALTAANKSIFVM